MSLSIGIAGLPNVGKSTLFNALTDNQVLSANYPFATIDPNVGIVSVPDERLYRLGQLYPGSPVVPADIKFTDIAGLVAGAHKGEGLGNQFLANIRETNAIAQVVRAFDDPNVSHVSHTLDPERDIETINTELVLADLSTLDGRLQNLDKQAKSNPALRRDLALVTKLRDALDDGILIKEFVQPQSVNKFLEEAKISNETVSMVKQLLTAKPFIYVFNVDEDGLQNESKKQELSSLVSPSPHLFVCAQLEAELSQLDQADMDELLAEYGLEESGLSRLARSGYETLELQSFFTAGEKEVKAWAVRRGAKAPEAAGAIHSDFERGFIAAEIINWQDLLDAGSVAAARKQGLLRTEGKDYVMQDGDVTEFRFNV